MGVVAASPNSRILIDNQDMSGFVNAAQMDLTQESMDARVFNSTGPRNQPGNYDHKHKLTALFDGASNVGLALQSDEVLHGLLASDADHYYAELWGANVAGSKAYESIVKLNAKPTKGAIGQLITIDADFVGNGPVSKGIVMANAVATSSGSYTGQHDLNADWTTAQSYQAVYRALSGSSFSMTMEMMESSDGVSYTSMTGMSAVLTQAAPVARKSSTLGGKQYHKARISAFSGSATARSIIVTGGLVSL